MTETINLTEIGPLLGALAALIGIVVFIFNTWSKLRSYINKHKEKKWEKYSKNYFDQINSKKFIFFRNEILKKYYDEYRTEINSRYFPVYTFEGIHYNQPFSELYDIKELNHNAPSDFMKNDYKKNKYYKKYKDILYKKAKYPDKRGFMLNELIIEEQKIRHFSAWVGKYADNDYTSQILEYELYSLFLKFKIFNPDKYNDIKKCLIIRNSIHAEKSNFDVLRTGCNRASLLGIQLMILLKCPNEKYEVVTWKRKDESTIVYPDYYQFPPAGVFDVTVNSGNISQTEIEDSFSVVDVICREFIEELFANESRDVDEKSIKDHPRIKQIKNMINDGLASLIFLGTAVDLVNLRNDLCFVLKIDDVNYSEKIGEFTLNEEGRNYIKKSIEEMERIIKKDEIVPASVGLWYMFKRNHLFNDIN